MSDYPTQPSYSDLHEGCIKFAELVVKPPDVIVGLARGGMFNTVVLSHIYDDAPMISVDYSSNGGAGDNVGSHTNTIPAVNGNRILIVDDICDSGYTLKEVAEVYESRGHVVHSYVSYLKSTAIFQPSGWTWMIPENSPWICFPWEIN